MASSLYVGEEVKAYYIEEASYGVTPSGTGQPAMLWIGVIQEVEPALDPRNIIIRGIGSRNVKAIRRGLRHVDLKLSYIPQDWDFLPYARNDKSLSIEVFYEKASGIISLNHKGCKIDRYKIDGSIEEPVKISVDLIGQDVAVATAKIGASYEAEPTVNPITGSDCVIQKGGLEITRFSDFSFEIINNLKRQPVIRSTTPYLIKGLPIRHETLQGSIRADFESKAELDDILGDTAFSLAFIIGPAGNQKTFTFSDCKWRSSRLPTKIEDTVAQLLEWEAKTLTIS